ncbi:hypothetical protein P7K49_022947, partial [Saguinus oedipus]
MTHNRLKDNCANDDGGGGGADGNHDHGDGDDDDDDDEGDGDTDGNNHDDHDYRVGDDDDDDGDCNNDDNHNGSESDHRDDDEGGAAADDNGGSNVGAGNDDLALVDCKHEGSSLEDTGTKLTSFVPLILTFPKLPSCITCTHIQRRKWLCSLILTYLSSTFIK